MLEENMPPKHVIHAQPDFSGALREAVASAVHDPEFVRFFAEQIIDALDGFDDKTVLQRLKEAMNDEYASEAEVIAALKGK
jgi:hypothetical protein